MRQGKKKDWTLRGGSRREGKGAGGGAEDRGGGGGERTRSENI